MRHSVPPTKRKTNDAAVGSSVGGTPGWNRSTSTPLGTTETSSGSVPLRMYASRTHRLGTHTSSAPVRSCATQSAGTAPYSHGW